MLACRAGEANGFSGNAVKNIAVQLKVKPDFNAE
jgi:hypothetical protein